MTSKHVVSNERFEKDGIGSLEWAIAMRRQMIEKQKSELKKSEARLRALLRLKEQQQSSNPAGDGGGESEEV